MANETFTATQITVLTNDVGNDGQIDPGRTGVGNSIANRRSPTTAPTSTPPHGGMPAVRARTEGTAPTS